MSDDSTGNEAETSGNGPIGLTEAYAVQSPDDNRALYAKWADTYESEFAVPRSYTGPRTAAEVLCEGLSGSGPVLDAGCGTGLAGEHLRTLGVAVVDGFDISPEMLAKARAKTAADGSPVYRKTVEVDLTGPVDIADDTYAGIVSIGTFTHGHVGPEAIEELLRIACPGARGVIGVHSSIFESDGFKDRFERYEAEGVIHGLEVQFRGAYEDADGSDPNQMVYMAVFTVV
ncbi:MAG: methyltransferase domain-containing protein [Acidimicrobiaceae bacterium]|nr:methyltransferase domain-containing protein [Acidimicrobiia bacterium]MCY4494188.1 methyltransferase domain-containing protein [Acidimicrobiaceae bacterium]